MPKGPQGQKLPTDAITRAVMAGRVATGEIEGSGYAGPRGQAGGIARSTKLPINERQRIAKAAAEARWKERRVG